MLFQYLELLSNRRCSRVILVVLKNVLNKLPKHHLCRPFLIEQAFNGLFLVLLEPTHVDLGQVPFLLEHLDPFLGIKRLNLKLLNLFILFARDLLLELKLELEIDELGLDCCVVLLQLLVVLDNDLGLLHVLEVLDHLVSVLLELLALVHQLFVLLLRADSGGF